MRALEIPESLLKRAEELAHEDGVSLDTWVTSVLARRIGAIETITERGNRNRGRTAESLVYDTDRVPDLAADAVDGPPDGVIRH